MTTGEKFVKLLGFYTSHESGSEKALFHERMERAVEELGIEPIAFRHPMEDEIEAAFDMSQDRWTNMIISGEAGVGKTRIIHKLVREVLLQSGRLKEKGAYWKQQGTTARGTKYTVYVNRDLSASRKFGAEDPSIEERQRLELWSRLILGEESDEGPSFFIMAANDGQLLKAWKDYSDSPKVAQALEVLESYTHSGKPPSPSTPLRLVHLSSLRADIIFDLCLTALLKHSGWDSLLAEHSGNKDIFCENSPIRRNYEGLKDETVRKRLLDLALLCDSNDWHFPVRNILAMLANAILGCGDRELAPSGVMNVETVRQMMAEDKPHSANFFANILGLNLPSEWREKILGPIESFRVGLETVNEADGLILFGPDDDDFTTDHAKVFLNDPTFPYDPIFEAYRSEYITSGSTTLDGEESPFYQQLIAQRRRLFFRVPDDMEDFYNPWGLTNFHYAKEYLEQLLAPAKDKRQPAPRLLGPLIVGLNRIWTGLLFDDQDQLFITTALGYATAGSSDIEIRRIPTKSLSGGEFPFVHFDLGADGPWVPKIAVFLKESVPAICLHLTLTRFEFLKRVADGALPSSFSKECSEDIRAFKSRILANLSTPMSTSLRLLRVNADGKADSFALNLNY